MKLTKKDFKAWLELHENEEVGRRANAACCPIAKYVNDTQNASSASAGWDNVIYTSVINGRDYRKKLPNWAIEFIWKLDRTPSFSVEHIAVTGKKALEVLG